VYNTAAENAAESGFSAGEIVQLRKDGVVVQTDDGQLLISHVQAESKKPMLARDWANGLRVSTGDYFEFVTSSPHKDVS
jgi:methionyl-tRNA formyltransferase